MAFLWSHAWIPVLPPQEPPGHIDHEIRQTDILPQNMEKNTKILLPAFHGAFERFEAGIAPSFRWCW